MSKLIVRHCFADIAFYNCITNKSQWLRAIRKQHTRCETDYTVIVSSFGTAVFLLASLSGKRMLFD